MLLGYERRGSSREANSSALPTASVTIPIHGGREIGPPLFFKIVRQLGVTPAEFLNIFVVPDSGTGELAGIGLDRKPMAE